MGKRGSRKKKRGFLGSIQEKSLSAKRKLSSSSSEENLNSAVVSNVSTSMSTADFDALSSAQIKLGALRALITLVEKEFPDQFDEICPKVLRDKVPDFTNEILNSKFFHWQRTLNGLNELYQIFNNNFEGRRRERERAERRFADNRNFVAGCLLLLAVLYLAHQYIENMKQQKS